MWVLGHAVQTDVDACLWELEADGSTHLGCAPLPFPSLTPLGQGHSTHTPPGSAAVGPTQGSAAPALPAQLGSTGAEGWLAAPVPGSEQQLGTSNGALSLGAPTFAARPASAEHEAGSDSNIVDGGGSGSGTPPSSQRAEETCLAEPPAALSPTTTAFVGAAYAARDTEAAEHAAQPCSVLDTSLRDADVETGRCAGGGLAGRGVVLPAAHYALCAA